jgi:4-hydroxybenzoate polyprenyltransferase
MDDLQFYLLGISTVLIAAAGYVINDYFDVKIDQVNKPKSLVVDRDMSRLWAIFFHWLLTTAGILVGAYVAFTLGRLHLVTIHIAASLILWFYSTSLKCTPLIGNVAVSVLTGLVVVIVAIFEIWFINRPPGIAEPAKVVAFLVFTYAGFAFFISMVREIVKDIEDQQGDAAYHCNTLPNVAGIRIARHIALIFAALLTMFVLTIAILEAVAGNFLLFGYGFGAVGMPLLYIIWKLNRADTKKDYARLSQWIKLVMLAGILSMLILQLFENPENYFVRYVFQ